MSGLNNGGSLEKIMLNLTIPKDYINIIDVRKKFAWRFFMHEPGHLMKTIRGKKIKVKLRW